MSYPCREHDIMAGGEMKMKAVRFTAQVDEKGTIAIPRRLAVLRQHRVGVTLVDKGNGLKARLRVRHSLAGSWGGGESASELVEIIRGARVDISDPPAL